MILISFIGFVSLIVVVIVFCSYDFAKEAREEIYLLDHGQILKYAHSQDITQNRPAEGKDHVKRLHELLFTLSPDEDAIEYNIAQALPLADESVLNHYQNLKEKGFYNNLIAANVSQTIQVDSVGIDMEKHPYKVMCYAKQIITRSSSITHRILITECQLRDVQRSDNNPHGFLAEKWRVLNNSDLKTFDRLTR